MVREEWRLHSRLFGGGHFAAFPVLVAALAAGGAALLASTGTATGTVLAGLHALAFVFGLHTGSVGLVGRDALDDLLGDVTLLVSSARTLPLSPGRLLGVFVLKDVVYYALLFLFPMALGTASGLLGVGELGPLVAAELALGLWASLAATFVLGMGTTLTGLGLSNRGVRGLALLAAVAAAAAAAWVGGVDLLAYTPYGAFRDPTLPHVGAAAALVVTVTVAGAAAVDPAASRPARTVAPAFRRWLARVGDPVAAKTLLDLRRSAGGVGKVGFSAAVLFGVTVGLVDLAGRITGVAPSVGVSFGAVLGLSGFTTYNWLTQSEDVDASLAHPLTVGDVFAAKFRAFVPLGPPVGLAFYAVALGWLGTPPLEAVVGAVLLVGVACYVVGTTAYLAGLSPNEFLFDAGPFAAFGAAMVVPLVPILVVGFALAPVPTGLLAGVGLAGVGLAGVGVALYWRAIPKWTRRYRRD